jgi:hypothetical protein
MEANAHARHVRGQRVADTEDESFYLWPVCIIPYDSILDGTHIHYFPSATPKMNRSISGRYVTVRCEWIYGLQFVKRKRVADTEDESFYLWPVSPA